MPRASVIVPARDAQATLPRTLAALRAQELDGGFEVIVVDDGSRDSSPQLARAAGAPVVVLSQPPRGPAAARNLGVSRAGGELLAFCDADVFPTPGWLAAGVRALGGAELVQGRVLPDPAEALGPFDRTIWINSNVGLHETANLFVSRKTFERAGGFEEWLRPRRGKGLAEDVWFGYRARRTGARAAYCAEALAHHAVFPRSWQAYVGERARLQYFPAMAARMPELRETFLHRRFCLNKRTERFDTALAAAALAAARGTPLPLIAALPYLRALRFHARRARPLGPPAPAVAAADALADLVGAAALAYGSARYRALVI
jgi:glycosyltransferase involved in cell wall biosynthesis